MAVFSFDPTETAVIAAEADSGLDLAFVVGLGKRYLFVASGPVLVCMDPFGTAVAEFKSAMAGSVFCGVVLSLLLPGIARTVCCGGLFTLPIGSSKNFLVPLDSAV